MTITSMRKVKSTPMSVAAAVVKHWLQDYPMAKVGLTDISEGELVRRIAQALANNS